MNEKKCKVLRRVAEKYSVGMPKVAYKTLVDGQIILDEMSTRGTYQKLKKHAPK